MNILILLLVELIFMIWLMGKKYLLKFFLIHPNYTGIGDNHNDICLLTLDDDLEFNDNVKAIALNNETVDSGTKCIVSGWGTLTSGGDTSDVLQFVELNFWSNDQCNTAFEVTDYYIDPIAEICAYDEGKDSCQGD